MYLSRRTGKAASQIKDCELTICFQFIFVAYDFCELSKYWLITLV